MRYTIFDKLSLDIVKIKRSDIQLHRLKKQTIFGIFNLSTGQSLKKPKNGTYLTK